MLTVGEMLNTMEDYKHSRANIKWVPNRYTSIVIIWLIRKVSRLHKGDTWPTLQFLERIKWIDKCFRAACWFIPEYLIISFFSLSAGSKAWELETVKFQKQSNGDVYKKNYVFLSASYKFYLYPR